jgi:hypothetical protein
MHQMMYLKIIVTLYKYKLEELIEINMSHSNSNFSSNDGWNNAPTGWNHIESPSDFAGFSIFNGDLTLYPQEHIFVLAGGLDQMGRNHPWVNDRLDLAIALYKIKPRKIYILGGGTYHKAPYFNREKFVIHESTMGAKYLIEHGVAKDDIYREWASYDTIANAFFSLLHFVVPLKITSFIVITSDFHMPRAKEIFQWIYSMWTVGAVGDDGGFKIDYLQVNSDNLDNEIVDARKGREARSLIQLKNTIQRVSEWSDFHRWFYVDHQAYNCNFDMPKEKIDRHTSNSY